jgi:lysophospholipase L1-like esterase
MFFLVPAIAMSLNLIPKPLDLPPMLTGVKRIVMMGDSITQMGAAPHGYVTLLDHALKETYPGNPIEVVNVGIGGQKAPDMHARFKKDVLDKHPDMVMISVGVNDVWHDFRTPEWTARDATGHSGRGIKLDVHLKELDAMVSEAKSAGIRVVMLSPTVVYEDLNCDENKRMNIYVDAQRKLAQKNQVPFVNLNKSFQATIKAFQREAGRTQLLLTTDGVHLNDQGNTLMANCILRTLGVPLPERITPH